MDGPRSVGKRLHARIASHAALVHEEAANMTKGLCVFDLHHLINSIGLPPNHHHEHCYCSLQPHSMSSITILNQIIDDEEGVYRIRHGKHVRYVTIAGDVFDEDTMCRPYLLIPKLPTLPEDRWTRMKITRSSEDGTLQTSTKNEQLPEIETLWHPQRIDVLSLEQTRRHRSNVDEVLYNGTPAVAKIAAFEWEIPRLEWEIPRLERETWAYMVLHQHESGGSKISPQVLGHFTESERVIGLLLEKLDGRCASAADLLKCTEALKRLHRIGLTHGDVNRYNFIIDDKDGTARMVDFEHASAFEEAAAKEELESLVKELSEETGRGGPAMVVEG